jgi:SAM-dependent methyltransferase
MREEWNARAKEDAHYYVAFGRRGQEDAEFFDTAKDLIRELETELKRLPAAEGRRALEIGCGPGRLLRPMSRHFSEIHGIDVSDEMAALAGKKLADLTNVQVHAASGSDLRLFANEYFDFVYSYAVFQHIPSEEVVWSYLRETVRVLKPGGIARLHINGLPKTSKVYTTWEGARIGADEVRAFTCGEDVQLLSLTGIDTQYMWTTWRKLAPCRIRSIANAFSSEQAVPASGRLACAALTVANLPGESDLNSLAVVIDGAPQAPCYIGPPGHNGATQVNVFLPEGLRTGLLPVWLELTGRRLCAPHTLRVIPPGPAVPRLTALSDAVNLCSPQRIESGLMKATIEEVDDISKFAAMVDGVAATDIDSFRTDPLCERWEVNFRIPEGIGPGGHVLQVMLGSRMLAYTGIEVVA